MRNDLLETKVVNGIRVSRHLKDGPKWVLPNYSRELCACFDKQLKEGRLNTEFAKQFKSKNYGRTLITAGKVKICECCGKEIKENDYMITTYDIEVVEVRKGANAKNRHTWCLECADSIAADILRAEGIEIPDRFPGVKEVKKA